MVDIPTQAEVLPHKLFLIRFMRSIADVWRLSALFIVTCVLLPLVCILVLSFGASDNIWGHLFDTVLPRYISQTGQLMVGVAVLILIIGVSGAWLTTMCQFPGRKFFEWALLLPLAMPAYVIAYTYTDLLEFAGPVQQALRFVFGWRSPQEYWFPEIRSLGGAIMMLSFVLYPYVYLMARASFLGQSVCVLEASRVLGQSPWGSFYHVALPLARPAIAGGMALALMETLNDIGTVDYFAVQTLTLGIYNTWLTMDNLGGAAQISLVLLGFVVFLIFMERYGRRHQKYFNTTNRVRALTCYQLQGAKGWVVSCFCFLPILAGFLIPACILLYYAIAFFKTSFNAEYLTYVGNSVMMASVTAVFASFIAIILAYGNRLSKLKGFSHFAQLARLGYAIPGTFLAVGILIPLAAFDNLLDAYMRDWFGVSTGLILSGSLFILFYAYIVRFLGVSYGAIESSLGKVTPHMDDAGRSLGKTSWGILQHIHFPLIRGGIVTGALIVFVDTMKELPATLLLRPFNFETLAVFVYQFASDELLEECALGAVTIVFVGLLPVCLLSRTITMSRPGH